MRHLLKNTSLILLSILTIFPAIGADRAEQNVTTFTFSKDNLQPLRAVNMGGHEFPLTWVKYNETIGVLQQQVAEMWNKKYQTNHTADEISLLGPFQYIGKNVEEVGAYSSTDKVSIEAIRACNKRTMHIVIRSKKKD